MEFNKKLFSNLTFDFPYDIDEYIQNPILENYHYHSSLSNPMTTDSPVSNEDYAKKIKEYGAHCIFSGEHGYQGNQFEVHQLSEKYNLKYRHSTEAYWVKNRLEKDNSNCHICIIAMNDHARRELNYILSEANISGYYYKPRIDLELLLSLDPNEFIITSACITGWKYEDADDIWIKVWKHFKNNFFLEVQYHNTDKQKELNKRILNLSHKYGIQLICGLDSHYISTEKDDIKRKMLLEEKDINYPDEEGWYLDYPNFNTVYDRFIEQGVLDEDEIIISMLNTNVFNSNKFEECHFSKKFKIPNIHKDMTYEQRCDYYKKLLKEAYAKEPIHSKEREEGIRYEAEQFIQSNTVDYPLITNAIINLATSKKYGGVLTTTSRGSAGSFYTNKLMGITTLDRFNSEVPIYPERFLTKERVLSGQMPDCDLNISEQKPFVEATRELLGKHGCYPLMTIGYLKEKSAFKMYARLNNVPPKVQNEITKALDKYNSDLKYAEEDEKDSYRVEDYIPEEYLSVYKESTEYQGIVDKLGVHACGHLIFDGDIRYEVGLIYSVSKTTNKKTLCACAEGKYLDDYGYCKEDFLIVDSVTLIHKFWKSIGQEVPTMDELRELIDGDKATWDIYAKGLTCCVNQMEKSSTTLKCMKYKPQNLGELASIISAIRPGFASLVNRFIAREQYTTGEKAIDDLLEESHHWALFQESLMKILNFCGLEMNETYGVIKAISKKKYKDHPEKLVELKNRLKVGWKEKIGNLDNFENVWQVIESSAAYAYNSPHALSMAGDSAYQAYFKAHYTDKFYEVAINHYIEKKNKKKVDTLIDEARNNFGYKTKGIKFGDDNREYKVPNGEKTIHESMNGIKDMQSTIGDELYKLSQKKKYNNFLSLLFDIKKKTSCNKTSLDILIKLDYFSDFGDINYLLNVVKYYNKYIDNGNFGKTKRKQFRIADLDDVKKYYPFEKETILKFKTEESKNGNTIYVSEENMYKLIVYLCSKLKKNTTTLYDKITYEATLLGYVSITSSDSPYWAVTNVDVNQYGTPFASLYRVSDGLTGVYKVNRQYYKEYGLNTGDIIYPLFNTKNKSIKKDNKWVQTDETYEELSAWKWSD